MIRTIKAEIFKFWFDIKRYLFNYIMGTIATSIFLGGIYWGTKSLFTTSGQGVTFIGILLWLFASSAISDAAEHLTEERYLGTLERISITKSPILYILIARFIVNFLFTIFRIILIGSILYIIFKPKITFVFLSWGIFLTAFLLSILIIITLYGFGLLIASLGLIFKRTGAVTPILEYLILFLSGIIIPWEKMPRILQFISNLLPMTYGIRSLTALQNNGNFWFCFINCIIYTLIITGIGYTAFHYAINFVKKKGEYAFY